MKALLDTGPWVAFIDRSESKHALSVEWLQGFEGTLYTTEAVLTEVLYLLSFSYPAQAGAFDFILNSAVNLVPPDRDSLKTAKCLMNQFADLPMDYADATLVTLAMDTGITDIATFDKRDFSLYRAGKNKKFNLVIP